jgi:predicted Zn-dependent protease
MLGANVGAQLTQQAYSREAETEADIYGMRYMRRAGYDPAAAVTLQQTFVRLAEDKQPNWLAGLFASHPPSQARVDANRALLREMGNPGGEVGEARYRQMTARIRRSKPAYEAYDEARRALKKKDLRTALARVDRAIEIEPKEAAFYTLRGEIRAAQKNDKSALRDLDRAVALNPDYFRPLLVRGITRREAGALQGSRSDLERSVALLPTAEGYYGLGQVAALQGQRQQAVSYFQKAATSESRAGRLASKQLAQLDLEANPARYLSSELGLSKDGYLVVKVTNGAGVSVKGVQLTVGKRVRGGIQKQARYQIRRTLSAGQAVQLRTDIGPMSAKTARGYGAVVTEARLVK